MKKRILDTLTMTSVKDLQLLLLVLPLFVLACSVNKGDTTSQSKEVIDSSQYKKAYIAGGCFWGMEALFRDQPGVKDTDVGYQGGTNANPSYRNHPGHAESLEIIYDSTETSFKHILDFFFRIHDPTTVNQQGNDKGTSYRSAIFYQNGEEKVIAEEMIQLVNASKKWPGKVVTTLEPYQTFWKAEGSHQDYLERYPNGYTCHSIRFQESFLKEKKKN